MGNEKKKAFGVETDTASGFRRTLIQASASILICSLSIIACILTTVTAA